MTPRFAFDNSFARLPGGLPGGFHARLAPTPVAEPRLIRLNRPLAELLGLDPEALASPEGVAILAGNAVPEGAEPLAMAYAGHQFGGFVPQLGDGRAILLGEVVGRDGLRRDIQLKGSGPTPFSRRGDGRAALGPVLREYLVSEAMAALGVPTTRALAAVSTGEAVLRETPLPGAVLARVASSHLRVGSFQFFAARGDVAALRRLTDYAIARHDPGAAGALRPARALLDGVVARQAALVAQWLLLGFIHGVMNTDNMAVSGETIDYGPCAFMDAYHPDTVFSSIDRHGRYAWSQQPQVAVWNLAQLASCFLPLMPDPEGAVPEATRIVHGFPAIYQAAWLKRFGAKLGLPDADSGDQPLIERLLTMMAQQEADFTRTFRSLVTGEAAAEFADPAPFTEWQRDWQARGPDLSVAARANPARIPRNHRIQQAIDAGVQGDFAPFQRLVEAVTHPFEDRADWADLAASPEQGEEVRVTYCGT